MSSVQMEFGHVGTHQQINKLYDIVYIDGVENCCHDVAISIEKMLQQLPTVTPECSIYRVPKRLLSMNPAAYTPRVISIGPFHHGQQDLMAMEQLKLRFFDSYLCRVNMRVEAIVEIAWNWEREARHYYAEPINMNKDDFVKMMLLDGCFIVELMIIDCDKFLNTQNEVDPSFYRATSTDIYCDLTMLENQLPFFVLQCLFDLISPTIRGDICFVQITHMFLNNHVLTQPYEVPHDVSTRKANHLVDFLSFYYVPSASGNCAHQNKLLLPPTATELSEAGVVFKKATENKHIMDIRFKGGVLKIPPFEIDDGFETYVRNLMAFEHFPVGNDQKYAIHYAEFLDGLITTEKDVSLLVKAEILTNSIGGSDREISKLFNDLCKNVVTDPFNYFSNISEDLQKHCEKRQNKWMATLKHNYFNTPWAFISFFAATFLILLTILQTIFSAISISK